MQHHQPQQRQGQPPGAAEARQGPWHFRIALCLTLLASLAWTGCSSSASQSTALRDSVTEYCSALRWGQLERAANFIPDTLRDAFLRQKRRAQVEVQIHEYEVRSVNHEAGSGRAKILILAVWSRMADPVTHDEMLEQTWEMAGNHWQMTKQRTVKASEEGPVEPGDAL